MSGRREKKADPSEDLENALEAPSPDQDGEDRGAAAPAGEAPDDAAAGDREEVEPAPLSVEEILRRERDAFEEKWLRVVAELDNFRKRSRREILETRRFAQAEILRSLLEVQDNFERALQSAGDNSDTGEPGSFRAGVELILQMFRSILKDKGVQPMEVLGLEFDPAFHEAVGQMPREGVEPGLVIEVVQQGFHFDDMVLRPARVIISS
jgi:molecular chaperone GrpE